MECKEIQKIGITYITKELSKEDELLVEDHIASCKECAKELQEINTFLNLLSNTKEDKPSRRLKNNFETLLKEEIAQESNKVIRLQPRKDWTTFIRVAATVTVVIGAFILGKISNSTTEIISGKAEQQVLALLENQSVSKRILAVNNTTKFSTTDTKIIDALIKKLFNDKNVNVRLAAAEALTKFSSLENVRDALIKSLETEKQPSLQIELIQILAKIQEKKALEPMKKLLENEETPNYVKQELRYNIASLL